MHLWTLIGLVDFTKDDNYYIGKSDDDPVVMRLIGDAITSREKLYNDSQTGPKDALARQYSEDIKKCRISPGIPKPTTMDFRRQELIESRKEVAELLQPKMEAHIALKVRPSKTELSVIRRSLWWLSEETISSYCEYLKLKEVVVSDENKGKELTAPALLSAIKNSNELLASLRMKDFYAYLGLSPNVSAQECRKETDKKLAQLPKKASQDVSNSKTILNDCNAKVFVSDDSKKAYDECLAYERILAVLNRAQIQARTTGSQLSENDFEGIVRELMRYVSDATLARDYLVFFCKKNNIIFSSGEVKTVTYALCPYCGAAVEKTAAVCPDCHETMVVNCPTCGKPHNLLNPTSCCGISFKNYKTAVDFCRIAEEHLVRFELANAKNAIGNAEYYCTACTKIPAVKRLYDSKYEMFGNDYEQLTKLQSERRYCAVLALLDRSKKIGYADDLLYEIASDEIAEAKQDIEKADSLTDKDEREALFLSAYSHCADYPEIDKKLSENPPKAVRNISLPIFVSTKMAVHIEWQGNNAGEIYSLIKSESHKPTSATSGIVIYSGQDTSFDDKEVVEGKQYYYGVVVKKLNMVSEMKTVSINTILPLRDLSVVAFDDEVTIRCGYVPSNACVIVRRDNDKEWKFERPSVMTDKEVSYQQSYSYTAYSVYQINGEEKHSPELRFNVVVTKLPPTLYLQSSSKKEDSVHIELKQFTLTPDENICFVKWSKNSPYKAGEVADSFNDGTLLQWRKQGDGFDVSVPISKSVSYMSIAVQNTRSSVIRYGDSVLLTELKGIDIIAALPNYNRMRLNITPCIGVTRLQLCYGEKPFNNCDKNDYIDVDVERATRLRCVEIDKDIFEKNSFFRLLCYYDGVEEAIMGVTFCTKNETTISIDEATNYEYEVKSSLFAGMSVVVDVVGERPKQQETVAFELFCGDGFTPLTPNDGIFVGRFESKAGGATIFKFRKPNVKGTPFYALFVSPPNSRFIVREKQ